MMLQISVKGFIQSIRAMHLMSRSSSSSRSRSISVFSALRLITRPTTQLSAHFRISRLCMHSEPKVSISTCDPTTTSLPASASDIMTSLPDNSNNTLQSHEKNSKSSRRDKKQKPKLNSPSPPPDQNLSNDNNNNNNNNPYKNTVKYSSVRTAEMGDIKGLAFDAIIDVRTSDEFDVRKC